MSLCNSPMTSFRACRGLWFALTALWLAACSVMYVAPEVGEACAALDDYVSSLARGAAAGDAAGFQERADALAAYVAAAEESGDQELRIAASELAGTYDHALALRQQFGPETGWSTARRREFQAVLRELAARNERSVAVCEDLQPG